MKVDDESLTSLLSTPALRLEFALLVALCTDAMRRDVLSNFPEPAATTASASPLRSPSSTLLDGDLIDFTDEEPDANGSIADDDRRRIRDRDLASPQMQGMRRAALSFFDAWRLGILRRVGEVLNIKAQAVRQRRAEYNAKAEAEARERRGHIAAINIAEKYVTGNRLSMTATIPTSLTGLEESKRSKILLCLLLLALSLERYAAHSRILLEMIAASLRLPSCTLPDLESTVSHGLLSTAAKMSAAESTEKMAAENAVGRRWKVGLATVAGAALIGVTGGLAAPFLAAGIGTVMGGLGLSIPLIGGYLGAMAGSSLLIGGLFGSYGGRMTGRMMEKYAKEVEDFSFVPMKATSGPQGDTESIRSLGEAEQVHHKLRVAVGISGWLVDESDIAAPWHVLRSSTIESFALRWEVSSLRDLGISITKVLKSYAWSAAKLELVRRTIFASLLAGLWPLGLLKIARVLDNPYSVAKARSDKAGQVLAEVLMQKAQGERPVTLVGFSLGARVIYQALLHLAERNAFGLVESVFLIGTPTPAEEGAWRRIRAVVAGRVVNVYSQEDHILGFLYRTSSLQLGVAGLQPVEGVERIENFDATRLMNSKGHARYRYIIGQILRQIGFEDIDMLAVEREEIAAREVGDGPVMGDLIPTDDLLASVEHSTSHGSTIKDGNSLAWADHSRSDGATTINESSTLFVSAELPKKDHARIPNHDPQYNVSASKELGRRVSDQNQTVLIETDSGSPRPGTPETEDEESDEALGQRIAMVDLDPEPIL